MKIPKTKEELATIVDYTLLKPDATTAAIKDLCKEALKEHFYSVCVNPCYIELCKDELKDSGVKICTVIGFPLGSITKEMKAYECEKAIELGADEVDMVMNISSLKSGMLDEVKKDIEGVVEAAGGHTVKVIIETGILADQEKIAACLAAKRANANFVKTSTGFGYGGATIHDISLMRRTVGKEMGVKASGGIKNAEQAMTLVKAGASRIGTSTNLLKSF